MITFFARYYGSIHEMPIAYFSQCLSGDLSAVSKRKYYSEKKAKAAWVRIFDEHLNAYGLPESYRRYIEQMKKAAQHYSEAYNGQKWKIVKARVYEAEARTMVAQESEKIETTCAIISRFMGFPVRPTECTVVEFRSYVDVMNAS